jgi:hypothetical protein
MTCVIIRDRTTAGQPAAGRCRVLLLHALAVGDWTYTQLNEQLPSDLQVCYVH